MCQRSLNGLRVYGDLTGWHHTRRHATSDNAAAGSVSGVVARLFHSHLVSRIWARQGAFFARDAAALPGGGRPGNGSRNGRKMSGVMSYPAMWAVHGLDSDA